MRFAAGMNHAPGSDSFAGEMCATSRRVLSSQTARSFTSMRPTARAGMITRLRKTRRRRTTSPSGLLPRRRRCGHRWLNLKAEQPLWMFKHLAGHDS
jgi:hypothetical protein